MIDTKTTHTYPKYKTTDQAWLGEIPEHWELFRLGVLLKDKSEKNKPELTLLSITREEGVIVRDIEDEESNHNFIPDDLSNYKVLRKGEFGMNKMKAWQGSYGISPADGIVSPAYYTFEISQKLNAHYFHIAIRSKTFVSRFGNASDGVRIGQWDLSKQRMKDILFPIPPLPEQQAIATYLDDKTAKIETAIAQKQKLIELLKERKQIVIQELVTGKKVWDESKQTWVKPTETVDSKIVWIGEIPKGWEVKRLKEVCKTYGRIGFRGYSTSDLVDEGEGAITISPSNIQGDFMSFDKCTFLNWVKYHESPEIKIFKNDVLVVKTGSTYGKVGYASNLETEATINPQLLVFKDVKIDNEYFYEILNSSQIQIQIKREVIGSTIPTISEYKILNMKASFPPDTEIIKILGRVKSVKKQFNKAIQAQQTQIERLKEYKQVLIDEVVRGKRRVC